MPSKLGLHVHRAGADIDAAIRAAPWAAVKALDDPRPLVTASDAGVPIRVLRLYGVERLDAPAAATAFLAHDLSAATHLQLVCEDARGFDIAWQRDLAGALRSGGYHGHLLGGGFATGTPAVVQHLDHEHFPQWTELAPLFTVVDGLALDQYVGAAVDDSGWAQWLPWTGARDQLVRACLLRHGLELPPVLIAESGIDNVVPGIGGGGWLARGLSADRYLQTLLALDAADQRAGALGARLLARCIFTLGAPSDWAGFEIASILDRLAAYVKGQAAMVDYLPARWAASPNFWPGRTEPITHLVLHGTGSPGSRTDAAVQSVVNTFQASGGADPVSSHYLITHQADPARPGYTIVYQFVREGDGAWGNGVVEPGGDAQFGDGRNPNRYSVSVETQNDAANDLPLTPEMQRTLLDLCADILRRTPTILHDDNHVIGHNRISPQSRQHCPGWNFPWQQLCDALGIAALAPGDTAWHDVPQLDQSFGRGLDTLHCGDTAVAEILQALGKRPAGLADVDWIKLAFSWIHPGDAWTDLGERATPQQIVAGIRGRFPDVQVQPLASEGELENALAQGRYVEGFVQQSSLDGDGRDAFTHFDVAEGIRGGMVRVVDSDRAIDHGSDWYPLTVFRKGEQDAPALGYGVAFWKESPVDPIEQEAWTYYTQRGVQIDQTHAVWTTALLPLYRFWKGLAGPMADLVKPGPIVAAETVTTWGGNRPAGLARLTNRVVGAYQDTAGAWHPYQAEL